MRKKHVVRESNAVITGFRICLILLIIFTASCSNDNSEILTQQSINCDKNPAFAEPFIRKNNYTFPVLYADADLRENYGVRGIPTTFIIDAAGEIKLRMVGFNPEEPFVPYLKSLVEKYSK